jgi:hypothetical protein
LKVIVLCGGHQDEKKSEAQPEPIPKHNMFFTKKTKKLFNFFFESAVTVSKLAFPHVFKITNCVHIKLALKAPI